MQGGAVLVLGGCIGKDLSQCSTPYYFPQAMPSYFGVPAAMFDLLGEPIVYRIIENLRKSGIGPIFLVIDDVFANHEALRDIGQWRVQVRNAPREELRIATQAALTTCRESGSRRAIVMQASKYVEFDVTDMLRFHASSGQPVTLVRDSSGPLGIAIVGSDSTEQLMLPDRRALQSFSLEYVHRKYANRLSTPHDLRRLAQDALLQRCSIPPNGRELRPGVWVAPSARLHPRARIVDPAYIGAHTLLRSGVVITRYTSVEHHCEIDRGSVVENATILPHTYLGSSLDIAHSIVNRNIMVDVRRAVEVEIDDRSLISSTSPVRGRVPGPSPVKSLPLIGYSPWQMLSDALGAFLPNRPLQSPASVRFSHNTSDGRPDVEELPRAGKFPNCARLPMNPYSAVVVKTLADRFDRSEVASFRREMQQVLRRDQAQIVLDLSSVTHLDSAGIEFLLDCLSAVVKRDGELKLAALSPQAETILEMTRVGRFFEVFSTAEDAVRSFDVFLPNTHNSPEPWDLFRAASGNHNPADNLAEFSAAEDQDRKAARGEAAA
jgi:anti-anti-sigma factor